MTDGAIAAAATASTTKALTLKNARNRRLRTPK